MRLLLVISFAAGCAGSGGAAAGAGDASGSETLRSTGTFIRACLEGAAWTKATGTKAGKAKVQLAPLQDKFGGIDTNGMLTAMERALLEGGQADVLPWGDALAGMASYQSDAMALGRGEESVVSDPDFIVGGTIDRVANGGTHTTLRLMNSEGQPVCPAN